MSIESGFSIDSVQVAPGLHQRATDIKKERRLSAHERFRKIVPDYEKMT